MQQYKAGKSTVSVQGLCSLLGYSKQAYYKYFSKDETEDKMKQEIILECVKRQRKKMPRLGARKLMVKICGQLENAGIEIGRDAFFDLLRQNGLLVKKRRRYAVTTQSRHWLKKYPNLLAGFAASAINQVWVSDITYIETGEGFLYLYLITDQYSHKIIGYYLSEDLKAASAIAALKMAIDNTASIQNIIHHSDRGVQYCSEEYVSILLSGKMQISMTEPASPLQNSIAERVNGILKDEWIYETSYTNRKQAMKSIEEIIDLYNNERPHSSCGMLTPQKAHEYNGPLKRLWKKYPRKIQNTKGFLEASSVQDVAKNNIGPSKQKSDSPIETSLTDPGYSLGSCSPAELPSALQGETKKTSSLTSKKSIFKQPTS